MSQSSSQSTSSSGINAPGGAAISGNSSASLSNIALILGAVVAIAIAGFVVWKGRK